jgi:hypothetical protein
LHDCVNTAALGSSAAHAHYLAAPPACVAEDVYVGCEDGEKAPAGVGKGAKLGRNGGAGIVPQATVEGCGRADGLREDGGGVRDWICPLAVDAVAAAHAVQTLRPPLERRNPEQCHPAAPGGEQGVLLSARRDAARASKGRLVLQKGNAAAGAPGSHGPWVCGCGVGGGVGDGPPNVPTVRSEFAAFAAVAGSFSALSQHVLLLLEPWKPKEKAVQPGVCKHGEQQSLAADTLCTSLMSAWRSVKSTFGVIVQSSARTNAASKMSDATPRRTITRSFGLRDL